MKFFAAALASLLTTTGGTATTVMADDSEAKTARRNLRIPVHFDLLFAGEASASNSTETEAPVPAPVPVTTEAPVPAPTEAPVPAPTEAPVVPTTEAPTAAPVVPTTEAPTEMPVTNCTSAVDGSFEMDQYVVLQYDRNLDDSFLDDEENGIAELYRQAWNTAAGSCGQPGALNYISDTELMDINVFRSLFFLRLGRISNSIVEYYDPFQFPTTFTLSDMDSLGIYEDDDYDNQDYKGDRPVTLNDDNVDTEKVDIDDNFYEISCGPVLYNSKESYPHAYWFRNRLNDWRSFNKGREEAIEDIIDNIKPPFRQRKLEEEGVDVCSCTAPAAEDVIAELNSLIESNFKIDNFVVGTDHLCNATYACDTGEPFSRHGVCMDLLA